MVKFRRDAAILVDEFHHFGYFQWMLKSGFMMKDLEVRAAAALRDLLEQVPSIEVRDILVEPEGSGPRIDVRADILVSGRRHVLVCEVKASGQPRHVRMALLQLRDSIPDFPRNATPILIAPYLSPESQALCREHGAGFLDLEGNVRLVFDGVFIERQVPGKPPVERRSQRSLFTPKSAQMLQVMLRDPGHAWRVTELANAAGVSLGHVSNLRSALLDREWAGLSDAGMFLSEPDALLNAWRDAYEPPAGERLGFYTTLHGSAFEAAARQALIAAAEAEEGQMAFASFSAAQWLAPYARTGTQYFYADAAGAGRLVTTLALVSAAKGQNVIITVVKDTGLFRDTIEPAPGAFCTSPVQTYLDLTIAGERGREAAEHLRQERLAWR